MALKQVIVLRTDLEMGKGKMCAQAAHASIEAFLKARQKDSFEADHWLRGGMPKIVVKANSEKEIIELFEAAKKTVPAALIKDAGMTQVSPGSITALGLGPAPETDLNKYTKNLKLL